MEICPYSLCHSCLMETFWSMSDIINKNCYLQAQLQMKRYYNGLTFSDLAILVLHHFLAGTGSKNNISEDVSPNNKGNDIPC